MQNTKQVTALFLENKEIIFRMAKKINRNTNELDDLIGEANLIFMECIQTYERTRGQFSKYLTTNLYYRLFQYSKRRNEELEQLQENITTIIDRERFYLEKEPFSITELSEDTKFLIKKIFCFTGKIGKGIIYNYAKNVLKWKKNKIKTCFKEIENIL